VEENLIIVTNDELARLCQGRYEIIHQTRTNKLAPEFFILDKFRDGGIRKVSTLSGGETFMVSLAMALGLAEMTRGTAEIDTLFIDEGFGTLDQDSLEDVLDMLNQIQNRGLMVGIISHVKALTSTLPVNLHVQKRQDGTSTIKLVVN
jgi:exonuclease SbcC